MNWIYVTQFFYSKLQKQSTDLVGKIDVKFQKLPKKQQTAVVYIKYSKLSKTEMNVFL